MRANSVIFVVVAYSVLSRQVKKKIQGELRDALKNATDTDDKNAIVMKYAELLDQKTEEVGSPSHAIHKIPLISLNISLF